MNRTRAAAVARVLVGIGLLTLLLWQVDLAQLRHTFAVARMEALCVAAGMFATMLGLRAFRLRVLVGDVLHSYRQTLSLLLTALLFNNVMPTAVGGDAYKLYYLRGSGAEWSGATAALLVDRFTGLASTLVLGISYSVVWGIPAAWKLRVSTSAVWGAVAGLVVAGLALVIAARMGWLRRVQLFLASTARSALGYPARSYVTVTLLSLMTSLVNVGRFAALGWCFGADIHLVDWVVPTVALVLAGLLPLSIGGLGLQEGALVLSISALGGSLPLATAVALGNRGVVWSGALLGGLLLIVRSTRYTPPT